MGQQGQLGHGTRSSVSVPLLVDTFKRNKVSFGAAGGEFSAIITEDHRVFTWGCNLYGQLGLGHPNEPAVFFPTEVHSLTRTRIKSFVF